MILYRIIRVKLFKKIKTVCIITLLFNENTKICYQESTSEAYVIGSLTCIYVYRFMTYTSSRGTKKSQFLNSDEEKPVSPEKSHSIYRHIFGPFRAILAFLRLTLLSWLFFVPRDDIRYRAF